MEPSIEPRLKHGQRWQFGRVVVRINFMGEIMGVQTVGIGTDEESKGMVTYEAFCRKIREWDAKLLR